MIFVLIAISGLIVGFISGWYFEATKADKVATKIDQTIADVKTAVATVETDVAKVETDVKSA